jgi:hypothetical protein
MEQAILLALGASLCTATASVCQRKGAVTVATQGFDAWLVFRLARHPVWLLGVGSMIAGFLLQLTALRFGALALVQPILSVELLLVFGYLAIAGPVRLPSNSSAGPGRMRAKRRDWVSAGAMSTGIGLFLFLASPSGGRTHATGPAWLLAGLATLGIVFVALVVAHATRKHPGSSRSRRAAVLGVATGISWGLVAAIVKELSSQLGSGIGTIFSTWPVYALIVVGAATMLLASHALAAGPLAASQPGFTVLDPLAASLLGVFLFSEHMRTGAAYLAGEVTALVILIAGATVLSHSCLIHETDGDPSRLPAACQSAIRRGKLQGRRLAEGLARPGHQAARTTEAAVPRDSMTRPPDAASEGAPPERRPTD